MSQVKPLIIFGVCIRTKNSSYRLYKSNQNYKNATDAMKWWGNCLQINNNHKKAQYWRKPYKSHATHMYLTDQIYEENCFLLIIFFLIRAYHKPYVILENTPNRPCPFKVSGNYMSQGREKYPCEHHKSTV